MITGRLSLLISLFIVFCVGIGGVIAQENTPEVEMTPEVTAEVTPTSVPTVPLVIFRDNESFTVLVPANANPVNLTGLTFRVETLLGDEDIRPLEGYPSLRGLDYTRLRTPICFRLVRNGATVPVPGDCQIPQLLVQVLANSDTFWFDNAISNPRNVTVRNGEEFVTDCFPNSSECPVDWPVLPVTPTPSASELVLTATATSSPTVVVASPQLTATPVVRGYPCEGMIIFTTGASLNQVKAIPSRNAPSRQLISQGDQVIVTAKQNNESTIWYEITYNGGINTGWIPEDYINLSTSCPR